MEEFKHPLDPYDLGYISNFKKCAFSKFDDIKGRASRSEFWHFVLVAYVLSMALMVVVNFLNYNLGAFSMATGLASFVVTIVQICLGVAAITTTVRRLHDVGVNAWFFLLVFVPLVNFYLLYLLCKRGDVGANLFGPRTGFIPVTPELSISLGVDETPKPIVTITLLIAFVVLFSVNFNLMLKMEMHHMIY